MEYDHTCTYSPDDNKIRMYPAYRLDKPDYDKVRAAGFIWAPKQELFVAPMWTPGREDLMIEMCGEIGDEDTSLVERAEERAERFEDYSDKRAHEAEQTKNAVKRIADNIPLGQPILIGHHSERHARKHARQIENGMRKAVNLWETSKYWERRAAGALHHAKYKELPAVRARRIKKIEADKRKAERDKAQAEKFLKAWRHENLTLDYAKAIVNHSFLSFKFPLSKYPRELPISQYEGDMSLWTALDYGIINHEQARDLSIPCYERSIAWNTRWITHYDNRLAYEKAMLGEQGGLKLIEKKPRPKQLPLLNYRAPEGLTVQNPMYYAECKTHYPQTEMTKAQYAAIGSNAFIRPIDGTHRVRCCSARHVPGALDGLTGIDRNNAVYRTYCVFLTDSKTHEKPEPVEKKPVMKPERMESMPYVEPERTDFDDMKDVLRDGGIQTVSAPQLFPTPPELAARMVQEANIQDRDIILEPSAGTGNILNEIDKIQERMAVGLVVAVEKNYQVAETLQKRFSFTPKVMDFLECNGNLGKFNKILMNPPFENGSDIKHIKHALNFLVTGGRLVALCANGPRQRDQLKPLAEESGGWWEDLPAGTFKNAGTNVNTAILVIEG